MCLIHFRFRFQYLSVGRTILWCRLQKTAYFGVFVRVERNYKLVNFNQPIPYWPILSMKCTLHSTRFINFSIWLQFFSMKNGMESYQIASKLEFKLARWTMQRTTMQKETECNTTLAFSMIFNWRSATAMHVARFAMQTHTAAQFAFCKQFYKLC